MIIFKANVHRTLENTEKLEEELSRKIGKKVVIIPVYLQMLKAEKFVILSRDEFLLKDKHNSKEIFNRIAKDYNFILWDGDSYYSVDYINKKLGSVLDGKGIC